MFVADWPSSLSDLKADIDVGRVDEVRVQGALPPGANGYATVTLAWDDGIRHRYASVVEASDASAVQQGAHPGTEQVVGSVEEQLRALNGTVRITRTDEAISRQGLGAWRFPGWFSTAVLLAWAASLVLLVRGPEPWWATRAAWGWGLFSPAAVVLVPLFLLLSGPPPGIASSGGSGRRLRGGLAFMLLWLVGPALARQVTG